jgi:uncharacterized peroxidase-related enzyme
MSTTTTSLLSPLTVESAPEGSRANLTTATKKYGFLPNLTATLANSPALLQGYLDLDAQFNRTGFTPSERQLILLTTSTENECGYCVAAHSTIAQGMLKVAPAIVAAVRAGESLADSKLNALVTLVREIVTARGHANPETIEAFLAAGYTAQQLVEILLGVALKTVSNYLDHLIPLEIDAPFQAAA